MIATDEHAVRSAEFLNTIELAALIINAKQLHSADLHFMQDITERNMLPVASRKAKFSNDDPYAILLKQHVRTSNHFKVESLRVNFQKIDAIDSLLSAEVIKRHNRDLLGTAMYGTKVRLERVI